MELGWITRRPWVFKDMTRKKNAVAVHVMYEGDFGGLNDDEDIGIVPIGVLDS